MFGYVRVVKDELLVKELDAYQAAYCGLCRYLRKNYGIYSSFFLSYDFVFLTLLLDCESESSSCKIRCPIKPFKKCRARHDSNGLAVSAAAEVILTWHKLSDTISDSGGIKKISAFLLRLFLKRAYKKACRLYPRYAEAAENAMKELADLEHRHEKSIDRTAHTFAALLAAAAQPTMKNFRIIEQILYHTARWIYIIDACDDIEKDFRHGNYNAVSECFGINDGKLTDLAKEQLKFTLESSMSAIGTAYELLPQFKDSGIIKNIIYCGLYTVTQQVLNKTTDCQKKEIFSE